MVDLKELTLKELRELEVEIATAKEARKEVEKLQEEKLKQERIVKYKGTLVAGDVVSFIYRRETVTGTIIRVSDKTITVKSDAFQNKTGLKYVFYSKVLDVITEDTATEKEAV